jgi:hypothetical protein
MYLVKQRRLNLTLKLSHAASQKYPTTSAITNQTEFSAFRGKRHSIRLFTQRLERLAVHGFCHALGMDHEERAQWVHMKRWEAYLLATFVKEKKLIS